jgi:hypothetical protein
MSETISVKDKKDTDLLQKDTTELSFIYQKSERLVSGLYVVTELLSDTEPIKWKLRDVASKLISDISNLSGRSGVRKTDVLEDVMGDVQSVLSFLKIARTGNIVSEMNYRVLFDEYSAFDRRVRNIENLVSGFAPFPNDFFAVPEAQNNGKAVIRPHVAVRPSKNGDIGRVPGLSLAGGNRRPVILDFLKDHPESTIKEITLSTNLDKECSEKTIQRELVSLVSEGLIIRSGERRWSKYSLKI